MSANHNDGINNAYKIIDMAKACGADSVKWQTYTADTITMDMKTPEFMMEGGLWFGRSLSELYQVPLYRGIGTSYCLIMREKMALLFFSSLFDNTAVDLLENSMRLLIKSLHLK